MFSLKYSESKWVTSFLEPVYFLAKVHENKMLRMTNRVTKIKKKNNKS